MDSKQKGDDSNNQNRFTPQLFQRENKGTSLCFLSKEAKKEPKGTLPKQNRFDSPPVSTDLPSDLTNKWRWNDTVGTTHWNFVIGRLR